MAETYYHFGWVRSSHRKFINTIKRDIENLDIDIEAGNYKSAYTKLKKLSVRFL